MLRQWHSSIIYLQKPPSRIFDTQRFINTQGEITTNFKLKDVDPSKLTITKTLHKKNSVPNNELIFGHTFTNHMLLIEWTANYGWYSPRITPYQNLSLDPACSVFHYAFECFEGMKAFKDKSGYIRLFRPYQNMARLNNSASRIALPTFNSSAIITLISKLVLIDREFIPEEKGYSLYIRPTLIGTQKTIGVGPPDSALLYVIASPAGPYYRTGFKALSLQATDYAVRAWPGGVGDKKLGCNYAPCIVPQTEAAKKGFQQNLWLFGSEEYITEVGTMNIFVAILNKFNGRKELITPPLDGTILPGITRDSILSLAKERLAPKGWNVVERKVTMIELFESWKEGRLLEAFGSGTAAVVSPIRHISWKENLIVCGLRPEQEAGYVTSSMLQWIHARQYGEEEHEWSYLIPDQN